MVSPICMPTHTLHAADHRFLLGDGAKPALIDPVAGGVGKALFGGGGSGPVGGGARAGRPTPWIGNLVFMLEELLCRMDELEVRGGKSGLLLGSIAEAGSGMLSLLLKPRRFEREYCPFAGVSSVSSERCCRERGGGGDLCAMPVGVADCDVGAVDVGAVNVCPKRCGD
jgi:hypothetical protein